MEKKLIIKIKDGIYMEEYEYSSHQDTKDALLYIFGITGYQGKYEKDKMFKHLVDSGEINPEKIIEFFEKDYSLDELVNSLPFERVVLETLYGEGKTCTFSIEE